MRTQFTHPLVFCAQCGTQFRREYTTVTGLYCCSLQCFRAFDRAQSPARLIRRFWAKVNKAASSPDQDTPFGACWLWTSTRSRYGYGLIKADAERERTFKTLAAHRLAYELASGEPIPEGLVVAHACDVRHCVRNDETGTYEVAGVSYPRWGHLFCAPHQANDKDRDAKGRGRPGHVIGEAHYAAKLTDEQVREIRRRYAAGGVYQRELAAEFGVGQAYISVLVRGVKWKHLLTEEPTDSWSCVETLAREQGAS